MSHPYLDLIGLPEYPLNVPRRAMTTFFPEDSKKIDDSLLADILRAVHKRKPFQPGLCYTNTETIIRQAHAQTKGMRHWPRMKSYAGWLLAFEKAPPVHHCWAVLDGQVIDMSFPVVPKDVKDKFSEEWRKKGEAYYARALGTDVKKEWVQFQMDTRKEWSRLTHQYQHADIIDNRIFGKIPTGLIYCGAPCTPDEARMIYNKWYLSYGKAKGEEGPGEASILQMIEQGREDEAKEQLGKVADDLTETS